MRQCISNIPEPDTVALHQNGFASGSWRAPVPPLNAG